MLDRMRLETRFGQYGGVYAPESLVSILKQVEQGFIEIQEDEAFQSEYRELLTDFAG